MSDNKTIYMIVADGSDEFQTAMRYASLSAKAAGAGVLVLRILGAVGFRQWGNIEERMKLEQRQQAEQLMAGVEQTIKDVSGIQAEIVIREGQKVEQVLAVLENRPRVKKLILAASTNPAGPGPLIEHFAGKGMEQLNAPLTIIPGHLSDDALDALL